ncbi:angiopoietin-related 7-like protein, partial [Mytilus galloprovincialis]
LQVQEQLNHIVVRLNILENVIKMCVMKEDDRKWTVIQRHVDFIVNFTRTWNEYKEGFGNVSGEHWLNRKNN